MSSSKKRKLRLEGSHSTAMNNHTPNNNIPVQETDDPSLAPALFIQAYEADIIRGPHAAQAARSLEVFDYTRLADPSTPPLRAGDCLIRWNGHTRIAPSPSAFPGEDEETDAQVVPDAEKDAVWVDRYDARLLLDTLPPPHPTLAFTPPPPPVPDSPTSWSDLPSDSEDTFFFSPAETEDFRRDKKRRLIERNREERVKARLAEDGESAGGEEEAWGGSDEEPEDPQKELMRRTAAHLSSSPNPAQLEMRILANHGGDARFAFLRGRWSRAWHVIRGKARMEAEKQRQAAQIGAVQLGLGELAGYGDSDEGSDGSVGVAEVPGTKAAVPDEPDVAVAPADGGDAAAAAIQARQARAKGWAEKRRALKDGGI